MNDVTTACPTPLVTLEKTLIRVGALVGGLVPAIRATSGEPLTFAGVIAFFALALAWIVWAGRSGKDAPQAALNRYSVGIASTMAVYAAAIAYVASPSPEWGLVIPLAIATMTPAFLCAHAISQLAD